MRIFWLYYLAKNHSYAHYAQHCAAEFNIYVGLLLLYVNASSRSYCYLVSFQWL